MPMTEAKMNKQPPLIPTQTIALCFVLELLLTTSLGVEAGEGWGSQRDSVGADNIIGGLAGTVEAGVGAKIGELEGVRKILEGDCDGEDTGDSNDGEIDDGDGDNGESDGTNKGENADTDGDGGKE
jgi:hypothetical protein